MDVKSGFLAALGVGVVRGVVAEFQHVKGKLTVDDISCESRSHF